MTIFYHVVEDDPLDSGGSSRVIGGNPNTTIEGEDGRTRSQAFLGHKAWCDACKDFGVIVAGPGSPGYDLRMFDHEVGDYEAVDGDLVVCKCERSPRIIAVHGRRSWIETYSGAVGTTVENVATDSIGQSFDDRYVLREINSQPMANTAYAVQREAGAFEYGETDDKGHTHLLSAAAAAENIKVFLAG